VTSVHPVIAATLAHSIERSIYDVSRVLLYPVLVAALFCLGWAIVEVGWFLYELYLRVRYRDLEALEIRTLKARDAFAKGQPRRAYKYLQESNYSTVVARFLFDLIRNYQTERIAEKPLKLLQEYEFYTVKRLEKTRILVRIGPMLGLMGTLIPLAPALAGLASGNTAILAANLEIAFSVTVIGLLIGGLGFIVSIVRDRFYQQDISDLEYMLELLEGGGGRLRLGPPRRQRADYDTADDDLPDLTVMPLVGAEPTPNGGDAPAAAPVAAPLRVQSGSHDGAVEPLEADEPTEIISWRPLTPGATPSFDETPSPSAASSLDETFGDGPPPAPLFSDDGPA
jgi:biopolymer transport protein ExbB/TolQ